MLIQESRAVQCSAMLITDRTQFNADSPQQPPTYFRSNDFLDAFQEMVNIYGVPRYKEITPVFLTMVTFPFTFGIMFGDIGHGAMLLAAGLFLCWNEDVVKFRYPDIHRVRYLVTMMGFFAVYAGFLYNDFFATGMDIFGSRWRLGYEERQNENTVMEYYVPDFDPKNTGKKFYGAGEKGEQFVAKFPGPYPLGVDPKWKGATNELQMMNSMKMKIQKKTP